MSGNLFKNKCEKIRSDLAVYVQQSIINEIKETYPDIEIIPIGSVGKRKDNDFNGDIDIAIKCKDVNELEKIISNTFYYLDSIKTESLYIISIAYPYQYNDNEVKYVQCDFMNVWDKDYTEFRYYCPNYKNDESQYKVGQKIMFANMIINHTKDRHKGLPKGQYGKFDFRPTALYRYVYDIEKLIYHCIVRNSQGFSLFDENMYDIDLNNIKLYTNTDKKLQEHEKDACETLYNLNMYISSHDLDIVHEYEK